MKLSQFACLATLCFAASTALAQSPPIGPIGAGIAQVGYCDCGYAGCGCEVAAPTCDGGCGGACGGTGIFDGVACGGCDLGDPFTILGHCGSFKMGGWAQLGYFNKSLRLFNSYRDHYQLQQAWIYAEKEVDTHNGGGIGGRIDYVYGTDGPDTQAFGINNSHWDNSWDNGGAYGHAIPQAYLEMGYGDLRVKAGHFYTIIGNEVVAAPENFFYSHAYTMYYSEPFTHTGAMISYQLNEDVELYGGYVLGWDSGFEDNGDAYLSGSSIQLTDDVTLSYASTVGRFFDNAGGNARGYMQSIVADIALTDQLQYIFQTDVLDMEDPNDQTVRETFAINQYLIRSINDCLQYGARFEWWQFQGDSRGYYGPNAAPGFVANGDFDIYALTLGLRVRPHANLIIRPEIRWDWVDGNRAELQPNTGIDFVLLENNNDRQTTFAIDTIFLF